MNPHVHCQTCGAQLIGDNKNSLLFQSCFVERDVRIDQDIMYKCLDSARAHEIVKDETEFDEMTPWLRTGRLPAHVVLPEFSTIEVGRKIKKRQEKTVKRCLCKRCDPSKIACTSELYNLCLRNNSECAITGRKSYWHDHQTTPDMPYWAISFDHIDPLMYSRKFPESWSITNIQLLCHAINRIKGSYNDSDVKE